MVSHLSAERVLSTQTCADSMPPPATTAELSQGSNAIQTTVIIPEEGLVY